MTERNPRGLFGVHDVRFYNRSTGESISHLRVLGDVNPEFTAEIEKLMGGSQMFSWDSEIKSFEASLKITAKEYDGETMAMLLGGENTSYAADSDGDVLDEANVYGTSVIDATTGIATVTVESGEEDELKEGWYVIKAVSATTVDIYAYSSANFSRGTDLSFQDDDGKITASPLTITASTAVSVPDLGVELTGGSGTIGMTTGDTARFYIQKPHGGAYSVKFGQASMNFDEIGVVIAAQTSAGMTTYLHFYRCKAAGMAIPMVEKGYATYDITVEPMYDSDVDGVGEFRRSLAE
jgi:hypothetical protein